NHEVLVVHDADQSVFVVLLRRLVPNQTHSALVVYSIQVVDLDLPGASTVIGVKQPASRTGTRSPATRRTPRPAQGRHCPYERRSRRRRGIIPVRTVLGMTFTVYRDALLPRMTRCQVRAFEKVERSRESRGKEATSCRSSRPSSDRNALARRDHHETCEPRTALTLRGNRAAVPSDQRPGP